MTDYNIDFLIAGLVFLIFLLIHFQRETVSSFV